SKFDGGLFAKDHELDSLTIKDSILLKLIDFSDFDFASDLNVNILGHIFEQSLSDIEEIKAQIGNGRHLYDDEKAEIRKNGKRKKEGIFYTPEYVTRYIVKEAIGGWLDDRKRELGFYNLPELTPGDINSIKWVRRKNKKDGKMYEILEYNHTIEHHMAFWEAYKERLRNIKVLDPACGSGAFLNQAFDYLYAEGQKVNEEISRFRLGQREIFELDRHILTNNLFGVDLNTESVEITKLSLWLKTARKDKELTALDGNIKCGNSLIDDASVAGERAFDWVANFPRLFTGTGYDGSGFDVVIGNPPYVFSREKIKEAEKNYYSRKYSTAQYQVNTYILFIERALELLKN
ncbi:MAG: N-6 DNA methylase, partial [Candidatus Aminicenantes bacterium]|nr:N-6 DNA methylase [Candidatus Aminicenantes bacterium]